MEPLMTLLSGSPNLRQKGAYMLKIELYNPFCAQDGNHSSYVVIIVCTKLARAFVLQN